MLTIIVTPQAHRMCTSPTGDQSHEHRARGLTCLLTRTRGTLLSTLGQEPFSTLPGRPNLTSVHSLPAPNPGSFQSNFKACISGLEVVGGSRIKHVSLPHPSHRLLKAKQPGQLYSLKRRSGEVLLSGWPGTPTTRIKPLKP